MVYILIGIIIVLLITIVLKLMFKSENSVIIEQFYKDYELSVKLDIIIEDILSYVPVHYLHGLNKIIITNSATLSHRKRRQKTWSRKKKYKISECRGLYYGEKNGAWIKLFIDNILEDVPKIFLKIPFLRDSMLAPVIYHEIGHHIHKFIKPEYEEREDVADKWKSKFTNKLFYIKYWYLMPVLFVFAKIIKYFLKIKRYIKGNNPSKRKYII